MRDKACLRNWTDVWPERHGEAEAVARELLKAAAFLESWRHERVKAACAYAQRPSIGTLPHCLSLLLSFHSEGTFEALCTTGLLKVPWDPMMWKFYALGNGVGPPLARRRSIARTAMESCTSMRAENQNSADIFRPLTRLLFLRKTKQ